jgi:cytochrome oxidase Cu insertion factor (SCO1/SenC/PrrC family)
MLQKIAMHYRALLPGALLSLALLIFLSMAAAESSTEVVSYRALHSFGGDFTLTDHHDRQFSLTDVRDKVVVIYFGFTSCADTCPLTLTSLSAALRKLGPSATRVQPLFISLDPKRDTPAMLRSYVEYFHPSILGLTGTKKELDKVTDRYRAPFYIHKPDADGFYVVDHSSYLYVIDTAGTLVNLIRHGTPADKIANVIGRLLDP